MFNLVLYNARIFGNEDADTVAVKGGRIVYVGPEAKFASSRTVDLHGMTLTPGFIDSHTHLLNLGLPIDSQLPKVRIPPLIVATGFLVPITFVSDTYFSSCMTRSAK